MARCSRSNLVGTCGRRLRLSTIMKLYREAGGRSHPGDLPLIIAVSLSVGIVKVKIESCRHVRSPAEAEHNNEVVS